MIFATIHQQKRYIYSHQLRRLVHVFVLIILVASSWKETYQQYCYGFHLTCSNSRLLLLSHPQQQRHRSTSTTQLLFAKGTGTNGKPNRRQFGLYNDIIHHTCRNGITSGNDSRNNGVVRNSPTHDSNTKGFFLASPVTVMRSSYTSLSSLTDSTIVIRSLFVRAVGFVYTISFLIALQQNKALIGTNGITPASKVLNDAEHRGNIKRLERLQWRMDKKDQFTYKYTDNHPILSMGWWKKYVIIFRRRIRPLHWISRYVVDSNPVGIKLREVWYDRTDSSNRPLLTALWFLPSKLRDTKCINKWLDTIAIVGCLLSSAMAVLGTANAPFVFIVWFLHRSIMAVGNIWYSYGWEVQLSEIGFHTLFIVPLWSSMHNMFHPLQIPLAIRWCIKWHLYRVMIGAGLIKIRSQDRKWKNLTAMNYFYETQPIPNPLSKYFHSMPPLWHKAEVILNHIVELIAPWILILPGLPVPIRRAGGIVQLIFQSVLVTCGNLSFLNWLTMVPAIMCLDDALFYNFLAPVQQDALRTAAASSWLYISVNREVVSILFLFLILSLSRPVVKNLLSSNQVMNRSYDPYQLVNTYGAFGTVNEDRVEYIISSACTWDGEWREYEFVAKPGNIYRSPTFLSPFHYRLDWQMWMAANYGRVENSPWMYSFLVKLLERDASVLGLMKGDPWKDSLDPPRYIRVQRYHYRFHKSSRDEKNPPYWDRELIGNIYPMNGLATLSSLKEMIPNG